MDDNSINIDIEQRAARGVELFKQGYNCAQAVALAFADVYAGRISRDTLAAMAASMGGGMGRLRLTCGAVTGMALLAGLENGPSEPGNMPERTANYALVQQLAAEFKAENDSLICAELLGLRAGSVEPPRPSERTAAYYKARPCAKMVECACRIYARHLAERQ